MRIGIDFGTTHTSAAIFDGKDVCFVPLDALNNAPRLLRSILYIDRKQRPYLGVEAVRRFLAQDTGRPVVLEEKMVGTIENTVASQEGSTPITIIYDVTIEEDVGARGRLLQSIKTGLRSSNYAGTNIFGQYYSLEDLIALVLKQVRAQAEHHLGADVRAVTLGRPVQFVADPAGDRRAEARLRRAAELAGFEEIDFVLEPIAAARFYLEQVHAPEIVLIFDFGGGTLDLSVVRATGPGRHEILATHGVALGGDDLDSAVMRNRVASFFGVGTNVDVNYDGHGIAFPDEMARLLCQWQTIPVLSRPKFLAVIERGKRYGDAPHQFAALESLVMKNYGFALFERIEQAKRALSAGEQTHLSLQADAIDLSVELTRRQFNLLIADEVALARQGVREVIARAGLAAEAVDVVVTTGGSSAVPVFRRMLERECPAASTVRSDAFGSVTGGLAIYAYEKAGPAERQSTQGFALASR